MTRLFSIVVLLVAPLCAQPTEKERALGKVLADEVLRREAAIDNPGAQEYVDELARRLAPHLPGGFSFKVTLLADTGGGKGAYEPLALPGGFIFLPGSLVLAAQNEAEVAGMLAHAMVHVSARHSARLDGQAQLNRKTTIPLVFIGASRGMRESDPVMLPASYLTQARLYELEADHLAVRALAVAGIDPRGLLDFIDRTQLPDQPRGRSFSRFPPRDQRLTSLRAAIDELPPAAYEIIIRAS